MPAYLRSREMLPRCLDDGRTRDRSPQPSGRARSQAPLTTLPSRRRRLRFAPEKLRDELGSALWSFEVREVPDS